MTGLETTVYDTEINEIELSTGVESAVECPALEFEYHEKPVYSFFKRAADIVLSFLALTFFSPVLLVVCMIIIIKDFGNPFFSQDRVGKDGKIFKIYKVRSMYKDAESHKAELMQQNEAGGAFFKIKDDPRILGKVGKFIRKSSIDELPQLVNILKGDMSIVGPRPFVIDEQKNMADERLLVRPGLSCYWQINGKNSLSAEMSDYYDKKYIMDRSFITDVKIIIKTIALVIRSSNE